MRNGYFHGLETLFTLICAGLQEPRAVVGWVQKYQNKQLRDIVNSISQYQCDMPNCFNLNPVTWNNISDQIFSIGQESNMSEIKEAFAKLWTRLADDFVKEINFREYNSIKHGFRARSGGFTLAVGEQKDPNIPVPPEKMKVIGGSRFGSSFFVAEQIQGSPSRLHSDPHFWVRRNSINWNPEFLASILQLISKSIQNVLTFLKVLNGVENKSLGLIFPDDITIFDKPWTEYYDTMSINLAQVVSEEHIERFTKDEILKRFRKGRK